MIPLRAEGFSGWEATRAQIKLLGSLPAFLRDYGTMWDLRVEPGRADS